MSVWAAAPLVVGHRGGRGPDWPRENTIDAFERARRQGAHAVELDVRTCHGGEVVVFHDALLPRETRGADTRWIRDVRAGELGTMGVIVLRDALSWARGAGIAVNVEMKHDGSDRVALARGTVHAARETGADVLLSSFDPLLLAMAASLAPALPRALLVHSGQPLWARALQQAVRSPMVGWLHLERTQVDARTLRVHLERGLRLGVWTVNDPQEALRLVRSGVSSIITDAPGAIRQALIHN